MFGHRRLGLGIYPELDNGILLKGPRLPLGTDRTETWTVHLHLPFQHSGANPWPGSEVLRSCAETLGRMPSYLQQPAHFLALSPILVGSSDFPPFLSREGQCIHICVHIAGYEWEAPAAGPSWDKSATFSSHTSYGSDTTDLYCGPTQSQLCRKRERNNVGV